jgi:fibronectin type 3 domain-containing protein
MFKKIMVILLTAVILIGSFIPAALADTGSSASQTGVQSSSQGITVQLEKAESWLTWFSDVLLGHGFEDWFRDNNTCSDYNYGIGNLQFIKVKITNNSDSNIVVDQNNQLVLQFTSKTGKELGLKLYEFAAYENINKYTRNYTFGSNLLTYRTIKKGGTWEIYGYTKWMNFSDLNCSILSRPAGNGIQVRLTESSNKGDGGTYSTDRIHSVLKLYNEGDKDIDLDKIRIHYYFNMDGDLSKVAPKAEKVEGKVYNYEPDRSNPHEYVISTLPSVFINMGEFSTPNANCFIEVGFPSKSNGSSFWNYLYDFLREYSSLWNERFSKHDSGWLEDILKYSAKNGNGCSSSTNKYYRWWWNWDKDYTNSDMNYVLSSKSTRGTSYVNVDLEIIKEILSGVTGDTSGLRRFNQVNHYSFNPGNEIDWDKVTVYYKGELIWGREPGMVPLAPVNLQAIANREGIFLKWDEVSGAEGYRVVRKGPDDKDFVQLPQMLNSNSFTDTGVTPGETYIYKVQAVSEDGEPGAYSNEAGATALYLTGNGLYAEYYNWKQVQSSSLTNYGYDESNGFRTNNIMTNTQLALTRVDPKIDFTGNNSNPYYKWGKIAPDPKVDEDHYSVAWSGYVMPKYSESYRFYTNTDDGVRLWIDVNRNGAFEDSELLISNWPKHSETENTSNSIKLEKGKKYKLRMEYYENEVDAVAQLLWSSPSQAKGVVPTPQLFVDGTITLPQTPTNLRASVQEDWNVNLTWDEVLYAEGYKIYETDSRGNTRIINVTDNFYTVPGLRAGEYTYTVSAYNEAGESRKSESAEVTVGLKAPGGLSAAVNNKAVILTWDKVTSATGYKIYRRCDGIETSFDRSTNKFVDNNVSWGKIYKYSVAAVKDGFEGIRSDEKPAIVPPGTPANLKAVQEGNAIMLGWNAAPGAQTYRILRSDNQNGNYSTIASGITGLNYIDTSVPTPDNQDGKRYYYKVIASANGVEGEASNVSNIMVYPFVETDLGYLRYNIINKSRNSKIDFVLGSYIPFCFELKLSERTVNPEIRLDGEVQGSASGGLNEKPFVARLLPDDKNINLYINSQKVSRPLEPNSNKIKVIGTFESGTVIKVEFVAEVSAVRDVLDNNIEKYYNRFYQLNFGLSADEWGSSRKPVNISKDANNKPILLNIKIVNPNKLN